MAEGSHISWTDNTFNFWIGCTKVSAGCDNCYAERLMDTRYGKVAWGKGNARSLTSAANRRKPYAWDRQAAKEGRRIKVFTASLSDVFDEEVPDEWRDGLFETIRNTPNLDWLVLTKRLAKMLRCASKLYFQARVPHNIWWGCSVEDQATANHRIPELLKLREFVGHEAPLWLSVEPLIGAIDLNVIEPNRLETFSALTGEGEVRDGSDVEPTGGAHVDWVIVGGESGPDARPMHPSWARLLRDQCVAAGVAFHFKQHGEWMPVAPSDGRATHIAWPDGRYEPRFGRPLTEITDGGGVMVAHVGKKQAGRLLDGMEWNEFPR